MSVEEKTHQIVPLLGNFSCGSLSGPQAHGTGPEQLITV